MSNGVSAFSLTDLLLMRYWVSG